MTDQHLITPPPELVDQWYNACHKQGGYNECHKQGEPYEPFTLYMTTRAARWGADQQLAKDAEWLNQHALDAPHLKITPVGESLKEAMRPKSPSLKEQALDALEQLLQDPEAGCFEAAPDTIRRALEALPND
jgi:hypothetical protein